MAESQRVNILLVDDRPDGLLTLEAVLRQPDYELVQAASGPAALDLLDREYAVILLDVQMPRMNGFELATLIKQRQDYRDVPIIFVTAINKNPHYVFKGYESGCVDYLFKPFDPEILKSKVAVFVDLFHKNARLKIQAEELRCRDAELHEARKIEAVGRLAGGVAHDFNNLVTGIIGIAESLQSQFSAEDPRRADLDEILEASERAFSLTRQLLAFGCRQVVSPQILDLNAVISNLKRTMLRLAGEDIELVTELDADLCRVNADPTQLEQVIINLVMNARDAMPAGGRVNIKTANIDIEASGANGSGKLPSGRYVSLQVSDTGCGMDRAVLDHIFEPFFSTKEKERGTGLGLSTVYGIAKQAGAEIIVNSAPGSGTTFTIYFPRATGEIAVAESPEGKPFDASGSETILVVEDEPIVRRVVRELLRKKGYRVVEASSGIEALNWCERCKTPIDLILTDVIMPGMNGRELARAVSASHPEAIIFFMSGFSEDVIAHQSVLDPGIAFIEKASIHKTLVERVRELLDRRAISDSRSLPAAS